MTVEDMIKHLKAYPNPEEQVIAIWYRKSDVDGWFDRPPTLGQWENAVEKFEYNDCQHIGDDVADTLQKVMEEE